MLACSSGQRWHGMCRAPASEFGGEEAFAASLGSTSGDLIGTVSRVKVKIVVAVAAVVTLLAACGGTSNPSANSLTITGLPTSQGQPDLSVAWSSAPDYLKQCASIGALRQRDFQQKCTLPYIHGMWNSSAGLLRPHGDLVGAARDWLIKKPSDGLWPIYYPHGVTAARDDIDRIVKATPNANVVVRQLSDPLPIPGTPAGEIYQRPGLLYLPNSYVVPGGIFNEQYGWDSYFIIKGLLTSAELIIKNPTSRYFDPATKQLVQLNVQSAKQYAQQLFEIAKGMADNHAFMIRYYGGMVNNANRIYYLTRSQPPLFAHEILAVYDFAQKYPDIAPYKDTLAPYFGTKPATNYQEWLSTEIVPLARTYFDYYTDPQHVIFNEKANPRVVTARGQNLSLYVTNGVGPVPEVTDSQVSGNEGFYSQVAEYFRSYPAANPGNMFFKPSSHRSVTKQLTQKYYRSDRATRASGYDLSGRFGYAGEWSAMYAPIDLQVLLYQYGADLNKLITLAGIRSAKQSVPQSQLDAMKATINSLLWQPAGTASQSIGARWTDYFVGPGPKQPTPYLYATTLIPLWAQGLAEPDQVKAVTETAVTRTPVDQKQLSYANGTDGKQQAFELSSTNGVILGCAKGVPAGCPPATVQTAPPAALIAASNFGIPTSPMFTGNQWDYPNGWAPIQDFAAEGFKQHGDDKNTEIVDRGWLNAVDTGFANTATIVEKYVVTDPASQPPVTAGYSTNQAGFGWTNAFYLDAWVRRNGWDSAQ